MPAELGETDSTVSLRYTTVNNNMDRAMQSLNLFPTKPGCCGLYYFICSFWLLKEQKCLGPGKNGNVKAASFKFSLTGVHKCNIWIKWSLFWDLFHKTFMFWNIGKKLPNLIFLGKAKMFEFLSLNFLPFVKMDSISTPVACCPRNKMHD